MSSVPAPKRPASPSLLPREPFGRRLSRRAVTVPSFVVVALLLVLTLPLTLPLALLVDGARRRPLALARALLFFVVLFVAEAVGVGLAFALFVPRALALVDEARFQSWNYALQRGWVRVLFGAAVRLFALRVVVEGREHVTPGPVLLLMRHVSVADTLFPSVFAGGADGLRLRYVLKDELLFDPCLDIVGGRIPNAFVRRDGAATDDELAKVDALARGLDDGSGVLLFPEGTRYTPKKRARALAKLDGGDEALAALAATIRHALPPRLGGALTLLDAAPEADVVFCAHTGFEGISTIGELVDGSLVGRRVVVRFWRVPRAQIPTARDERVRWLFDEWRKIDDLVDAEGGEAHRWRASA